MSDLELAKEVWAEIQREEQEPVLRFALEPGEAGLAESKVGGTPYLPREMPWPLDGGGNSMGLLAQVDCRDLSALPDFPHRGLLQFFVAYDDLYGMDFDDITACGGFRVLFHESVDTSVTAEEVEARRPAPPEGAELTSSPLYGRVCRIRFSAPAIQGMAEGDYRFDGLFVQKWNERRPDSPIESTWDVDLSWLYGGEERGPYHQLGGYPYFTQTDPRWGGAYPDLDVLLFQLDSQLAENRGEPDLVLWGDCGVGNFFISREALKKRDFSRVGYHWDCC